MPGAHEPPKPRIAVLPSPGMGHGIPLLELAKRLVIHHDIHITFLVITTNEPSADHNNLFQSQTLPPNLDILELPPVDVSKITTEDMKVVTCLCVIVDDSLKSLKYVLLELGKPKGLIIDLFCFQAFEVCNKLSILVCSFFTASIALLTLSLYLPYLDREVEGEFIDLTEPVKVPGCTPVRNEDLLEQISNQKNNQYKWYLLHVSRLPLAVMILLNSWQHIEPVALKAVTENLFFKQIPTPPVHPVGPLIKQEELLIESDIECLAWLDKQ